MIATPRESKMKVMIDISAGRLAIEGDGPDLIKVLEAARALAPNLSQIQIVTTSAESRPSGALLLKENGHEPSTPQSAATKTLRQFARSLTLDNASERIAAIAYYVNKLEGRQSFSPKELDGWFTMCGFQKPSQMPVALFDAKRKYGLMENTGRGTWRISNQGENMILRKIEEIAERGT
jgi:hypothetical protein